MHCSTSRRPSSGVRLVTGDKCAGMLGALEEVFPGARYQRSTVHLVPMTRRKAAARMLKAIHAQESREACAKKGKEVAEWITSGARGGTLICRSWRRWTGRTRR